jgi:hypothetical protein
MWGIAEVIPEVQVGDIAKLFLWYKYVTLLGLFLWYKM